MVDYFCAVSKMRVNLKKSCISGVNISENKLLDLVSSMGCESGEWTLKYFELPPGGNPKAGEPWAPVLEKS